MLSRRRLVAGTGAGILLALAGCDRPSGPGTTTIEMDWWGSTERQRRTEDALAAFGRRHPDIAVTTEFSGWSGYWDKLATRTAGGNPPDVIQMDYSYIVEYARRGTLRPLDDLVSKGIDLSGFGPDVLAGGRVDGKLYGVTMGINSWALIVNVTLLKSLKLEVPDDTITWADFATLNKKMAKAGVYGTEYAAYDSNALECWLRQRGRSLFTADGGLGFGPGDLTEWFGYWEDLRRARATAPADLQASVTGDVQDTLLVRRKVAFDFASSNQLTAYASLIKDELTVRMYPQGPAGSAPGQYLKPSMLMSMSAHTPHPTQSATLINALLTDPEITGILGSERGIPPSTPVRGALKVKADTVERQTYDFVELVTKRSGPLPPPGPLGAGEVTGKDLTYAGQQISFGKATVAQAVSRFFEDAQRTLAK